MSNKQEIKIIDEMQPLIDYLQGKSSVVQFIEECRTIQKTENVEFEIIEPLLLPTN